MTNEEDQQMNSGPGNRSGTGAASVFDQMTEHDGKSPASIERHGRRSEYTVLVVDDHGPLRYTTMKVLQGAGFKTLEAASGAEGILIAPNASAVVLDVNLPDIHGIEVLNAVRANVGRMPVVLTSAVFVDELHRQVGVDAGADAYLIAPLNPEDLISTLDRLLGTA